MPILGPVIGDEFPAVLGAAQNGNEAAFAMLWRDGNPACRSATSAHDLLGLALAEAAPLRHPGAQAPGSTG